MITISLFYFFKNVFILMNIWVIRKNSMKHYLKKYFYGHLNMEDIIDADCAHAKGVCKYFEIKNLR